MPFAPVNLIPGVDAERTPTLAEASYVDTNLIRFREKLVQKLGGWQKYYARESREIFTLGRTRTRLAILQLGPQRSSHPSPQVP